MSIEPTCKCNLCSGSELDIVYETDRKSLKLYDEEMRRVSLPFQMKIVTCRFCGHLFNLNQKYKKFLEKEYFEMYEAELFAGSPIYNDTLAELKNLRSSFLEKSLNIFIDRTNISYANLYFSAMEPGDRIFGNIVTSIKNQEMAFSTIEYKNNDGIISQAITDIENFDIVISRHIIEHMFSVEKYMKYLSSLVSDTGLLAIEYPDTELRFRENIPDEFIPEHISYFFRENFPDQALRFGYEVIRQHPVVSHRSSFDWLRKTGQGNRNRISDVNFEKISKKTHDYIAAQEILASRLNAFAGEISDPARLAVWAAGAMAEYILETLPAEICEKITIVDSSKNKIGKSFKNGKEIKNKEILFNPENEFSHIIIASNAYLNPIMEEIRERQSRSFVCLYLDIHSGEFVSV